MNDDQTITLNSETMGGALDKLLAFGPILLAFVAAFLFSPITTNAFDLPKGTVLLAVSGLLIIAYLVKAVLNKKLEISSSVFNLPVLFFFAGTLISTLIPLNKVASLSDFAIFTLPLLLVYLVAANAVKSENGLNKALSGLIFSAVGLSLLTIFINGYALAGRFYSELPTLNFVNPVFSPAGSIFAQTVFLIIISPLVIAKIKTKNKFIWGPILAVMTAGIILGINTLFANRPIILDYQSSWRIATGALGSSFLSALFGAGYNQYANAFTIFKPLEFNLTNYWNMRFASAGNYYFYILTVSGIATLAAFIWLAVKFIKTFRMRMALNIARSQEVALLISISLAIGAFVLIPASLVTLFTFFFLLGLLVSYYRLHEVTALSSTYKKQVNPLFVLAVAVVAIGAGIFYTGRIVLADYYFAKSLQAAAQNRGTDTYNLQIKAIGLNPTNDNYRVSYSQTNLALADALAATATPEAALITQLVQQAIREARFATGLEPNKSANLENLTGIYRSLINFAQGADQWALASQNQAINLDPTNPRLRLDLGGLYLSLGQYNTAAQAFSLAAQLKPDFANAHYNLAQAYRLLKNDDFYKQEMEATKAIVCATASPDCEKLNQELTDFNKEVVPPAASPSAQPTNLPKAKTTPPAKISSPSGELNP
ncbi:MAG: tetratricopeptide repeat protein [bacterium]|nr:tetratricopeptide repeat protein [bacterium]